MKKALHNMVRVAALSVISESALAVTAPSIPEPGVLSLLAAGGIVGAIIAVHKRRK